MMYKVSPTFKHSFDEFSALNDYTRWTIHHRAMSGEKYNCPDCKGTSVVYDPNDPRDPIEGNKMRGLIACPSCNGTGYGNKEYWVKAFWEDRREQRKKFHKEEKQKKLKEKALEKLTKAERKALGV